MSSQKGILHPIPKHARYMMFNFNAASSDATEALSALSNVVDGEKVVAGFSASFVALCGKTIPGLRAFPSAFGPGFDIPANQHALWLWLRGDDLGDLYHLSNQIEHALIMDFQLQDVLDAFEYQTSRDLTGYEDGTENPQGEEAVNAAIAQNLGRGLDGSSFVAVQQWLHDFEYFNNLTANEQDAVVGRRKTDNEELDDAPESAHVKRTAQESFSPEAFMLRRSMPWVEGSDAGLNFVAFGNSFDAFEAMLNRMTGKEDGITDALFNISRPLSGAYYWCPPMLDGKLDLKSLFA